MGKNFGFSLLAYFWASDIIFASVSSLRKSIRSHRYTLKCGSFDDDSFARCYHIIHEIDLRTHKMLYKMSEMSLCDTLEN